MKALTTWERAALRRAAGSDRHLRRLVLWLAAIGPGGIALSFLLAAALTRDKMLLIMGLAFLLGGMIPVACIRTVTFYEGIIQKILRALRDKGVDLEGFSLFESKFEGRAPRSPPEGGEHQALQKKQSASETPTEQGDREAGSQTGRVSTVGFSPWEMQLIHRAANCNIHGAKIVTAVSLFLGMLLGTGLMLLSFCYGWRNLVIAAVLWLATWPIFCFARWMIITLFHIIQKLMSQVGQAGRA